MKNDKGKVRNINTYHVPEELEEDRLFDEKFRRELIRESRQEAWELNHNPDLADLDEAPDLLESTIALIRETGNWDDEAWKKAMLEEGEDFPDEDLEDIEEDFLDDKSEESPLLDEKKWKSELSQDEVYELLSEENQRIFNRGKQLINREKIWSKYRGKVKYTAALIIIGVGVLTMTMNGYADPKHILKVWTEITDRGQNIHISKTDDSYEYQTAEEKDIELIKEKLGIKAPQLVYMPEEMNYIDCNVKQKLRYARMNYCLKDDKRFVVHMTKKDSSAVEAISIDGILLEEDTVKIESIILDVIVQKLDSSEEGEIYKADFIYEDTYYLLVGKLDKSEFIKILEKIIV